MTNRFDVIADPVTPSSVGSLLQYIQHGWSELLAHRKLEVTLSGPGQSAALLYEIYIGDEFYQADVRHLDVVVRLQSDEPIHRLFMTTLPAVLVFEKASAQLVQHELNGLALDMLVLPPRATAAVDMHRLDPAPQVCCRPVRRVCHAQPANHAVGRC